MCRNQSLLLKLHENKTQEAHQRDRFDFVKKFEDSTIIYSLLNESDLQFCYMEERKKRKLGTLSFICLNKLRLAEIKRQKQEK